MRSISKKIAFGDNLSRKAIQIDGGIPLCGKVRFSVVRKVLYTFLHHKVCIFIGLLFMLTPFICSAQDNNLSPIELTVAPKQKSALFQGEINANNINIRSDSTVNSKIICAVNKGEPVEVIRESYGWYKIRLPKAAPSFIRKNLVTLIDEKTVKVIKDNVNIRLNPSESSPILGRAGKNEVINILGDRGEWYKIEPLNNSFGWVNKKFVNPAPQEATAVKPWGGMNKADTINKREEVKLAQEISAKGGPASGWKKENKIMDEKVSSGESLTIEGIIKPYGKVIKRIATHKLITADNNVFLLKGNKGGLDSLNYHRVRVTGRLIPNKNQKYSIIEIQKIEALD